MSCFDLKVDSGGASGDVYRVPGPGYYTGKPTTKYRVGKRSPASIKGMPIGERSNHQGELITVQAAAERPAVSRWMIYRLIWDNQLKSVQIGRCRRVIRQSLDEYLAGLIDGAA